MEKLRKSDIVAVMTAISAEYPNEFRELTPDLVAEKTELWWKSLQGYPRDIVWRAVKDALATCDYSPKLSQVKKRIRAILSPFEKPDVELWAELETVLFDVGYTASGLKYDNERDAAAAKIEKLYEGLDDGLKLWVRGSSQLVGIAEMDAGRLQAERSMFLRYMPQLREQVSEARESEALKALAEEALTYLPSLEEKNPEK